MKHINIYFALISIVMLVLVGCTDNNSITKPYVETPQKIVTNEDVSTLKMVIPKNEVTYPLIVGKEMNVGSVSIMNDKEFFYVTYSTMKGWSIQETKLNFAPELKAIPVNEEGVPLLDNFAYTKMHNSYTNVYTYKISVGTSRFMKDQEVFFAANAILRNETNNSGKQLIEVAWGGIERGPGPNWWNYISYKFDQSLVDEDLITSDKIASEVNIGGKFQ